MNIPFDFSISGTAATESYAKLFDVAANLILANIISANPGSGTDNFSKLQKSANLGALDPTGPTVQLRKLIAAANLYVRSFSVTANAACKVRVGAVNAAGNAFCPVYTCFATEAVAGGMMRKIATGPMIFNDNSTWFAAIGVTPDATGTIKVAGDIEILPQDSLI